MPVRRLPAQQMPEGLSPYERWARRSASTPGTRGSGGTATTGSCRSSRRLLLSLVAVLAAYSGYAAAKWDTESSVSLAKASTLRTRANRADLEALQIRTLDSVSLNAWFAAFTTGNLNAQRLAIKRLRPGYRPAFDAWLATDPAHNPNAPPGPSYMPQYVIPQAQAATKYDNDRRRRLREGDQGGDHRGQVRPRHGVPRDRPLPRRDQWPLPRAPGTLRADRRRRAAARLLGHPAGRELPGPPA